MLSARVVCATGLAVEEADLAVGPLPRGASFDPGTGELRFSPALDQAGLYTFALRARRFGEQGALSVAVCDRFDDPANAPIRAPLAYAEETGLPVLQLSVPEKLGSHYKTASAIFRGHRYQLKAKLRGRSSADYPKKNYTLDFGDDRFSEPAAGMLGRSKIALTSTFDDNSQVRQRLAFTLWNRLGGIPVRHFSAVVYVNGRYHGIYTVTDHVDVELFSGAGLAAGGNLYKAIGHDAGFFPGAFHPEAYEKRSGFRGPVWLGAYSDLESLSRFIAESEPAVFRRQLAERISLDDYRAWFIAATAMEADDTLAKNAYHYREPGGRWRVVPFDFNASFGQEWDTRRVRGDRDPLALASFNHLFVRLLEDPQLGGETKSRFAAALRHDVPLSAVLAALDGLVAEVAPAAARDERRWRDEYLAFPRWRARQDFTDFDGEVAYVRRWIGERWSYLLTHI